MTEQEQLMTLEDARAVMVSAGKTLSKVSAFLATRAAAPDFRALLAAVLPYAESRAEDLQEAKDEGNEDPAYPGAAEAWAAVQAAYAALGGEDAPAWVIGAPYEALREIVAFEDDRNARMMVRSAAAYVKIVDMARAGLSGLPSKPAVPPPSDEARDIIYRLIEWADFTGGWEAPIWDEARAYYLRTRQNSESDQPSEPAPKKPWRMLWNGAGEVWDVANQKGVVIESSGSFDYAMQVLKDNNGGDPFLVVFNPEA